MQLTEARQADSDYKSIPDILIAFSGSAEREQPLVHALIQFISAEDFQRRQQLSQRGQLSGYTLNIAQATIGYFTYYNPEPDRDLKPRPVTYTFKSPSPQEVAYGTADSDLANIHDTPKYKLSLQMTALLNFLISGIISTPGKPINEVTLIAKSTTIEQVPEIQQFYAALFTLLASVTTQNHIETLSVSETIS